MTCVLLHGFTGGPRSFDALRLGGAVTPALAGHHGGPARAAGFRAEVDRLAALVPAGAHLIGYSLGGRLALGIALEHPDRVGRLTLIGAHPGLATDAERRARAAAEDRWIELLEHDGIEAFVAAWEALPMWTSQASLPESIRTRQRTLRREHDAAALAGALRALGLARMPDYGARLGELAAPVDVVVGALDDKFRELANRLAAAVRNARLTVIPDCGHNPVLERPGQIAELIASPAPGTGG